MQHTLYLAQYIWVSYLIPITFCVQTPEILKQRKFYCIVIFSIALLTSPIFLCYNVLNKALDKLSKIVMTVLFIIIAMVSLILLGGVFLKIHSMTKTYVGLFSNRKLIKWHFAFLLAALCLYTISFILLSKAKDDNDDN